MSSRETVSARVPDEAAGTRVDRYIADALDLFPRSQIAHRDVVVRVGGRVCKLSHRLRAGELVEVEFSPPADAAIDAEPVPLDIIFENDDVVVVNKPAGMVVHPAAGNRHGTLAQGLMHHVRTLASAFDDTARPGIVHRLDKDTSGVLIAAKHPQALAELAAQFKQHTTEKRYLAIVKGTLPRSHGTVDAAIGRDPHNRKRFAVVEHGGKEAVTRYRVLRHYDRYSFVSLSPQTGRTHQLRVHMASLGCPIVGDPVYSRTDARFPDLGLALHAYRLRITLPGELEARWFTARLPDRFRQALRVVTDPA
ncbi:MAG: RluA family pseudouridine synthase [Spirochaetota bacterium]